MSLPPGRWQFSHTVRTKGRKYLDDGKVKATTTEGVFLVQGSARRPYVVRTDADRVARTASWINCTCPHGDFAAGGAFCSHAVAVLLSVIDGTLLPVQEGHDQ